MMTMGYALTKVVHVFGVGKRILTVTLAGPNPTHPIIINKEKRDKMERRFIAKAVLSCIEEGDGVMKFLSDDGRTFWLTGSQRPSNVNLGDKGSIYYQKFSTGSYYTFEKE